MRVAMAFGLAKSNAVDNRRMVAVVRDDRIAIIEQCFEETAIGVEARPVENGVVYPKKRASASSRSLCTVCVPQMKRTEASPKP